MTTQLWIGFGFAAALVIFLIVSFFVKENLSNDQRATLKFLSALCAGFAGGLFVGEAVFKGEWKLSTGTITVTGVSGFAIFMVVWFFYPAVFKIPDSARIIIPSGANFQQATTIVAGIVDGVADRQGFKPEELGSKIEEGLISAKTLTDVMRMLRLKAVIPNSIREYSVERKETTFVLKVLDNSKATNIPEVEKTK